MRRISIRLRRALIAILFGVALLAPAPSTPAMAGYQGATELIKRCTTQDPTLQGICAGYIVAVADTLKSKLVDSNALLCIPGNVPVGEMVKGVVEYMKASIDIVQDDDAASLVAMALADNYTCP